MKQKYVKPQMVAHSLAMHHLICTSFPKNGDSRSNFVLGGREGHDFYDEDDE